MLYYFLPAILALGITTSYEDIRYGKIRNKWIIFALVYAIIIYSALIINSYFIGKVNTNYLIELVANIGFAVIAGFSMWYFGLWTAGDGKLFIAYSALIPLSVYKYGYQEWIPSITLLINAFILGLIFMLGLIIYKLRLKELKKAILSFLKNFFQPKQLLNSVVYLFAVYWIIEMLLSLIGIKQSYILKILLTLLLFSAMQKKLGKSSFYLTLALVLLRLAIDKSIYSWAFLKNFIILIIIWRLIMGFFTGGISELGRELFSKERNVKDLKPGMLLGELIEKKEKITKEELKALKKQENIEIIKNKKSYYIKKPKTGFELNKFINEEAEGLTKEQIEKIRGIGIIKIKVAQTIPFAPLMFLGIILTLIAKGNLLILVKTLF
ncbi:MAG: hypothetical protein UR15_C0033G0004 [Parcubacteria group bacterium GW2011_GWA2_31_28]|nr:MAG: hypothetical protein UR15_C0033G0004 [Parcubacteria group bacterium GW2011_GWA2_31_28]